MEGIEKTSKPPKLRVLTHSVVMRSDQQPLVATASMKPSYNLSCQHLTSKYYERSLWRFHQKAATLPGVNLVSDHEEGHAPVSQVIQQQQLCLGESSEPQNTGGARAGPTSLSMTQSLLQFEQIRFGFQSLKGLRTRIGCTQPWASTVSDCPSAN